mgnify:CR=1 FL=1
MWQNKQEHSAAAVVVTYNRLELLKQCIDSLRKQTAACDVLVVNNASTDGTAQWLETQPDISFCSTGSNLGGAGGFNYGMRWAVEAGYDYVWVMDDDTLPKVDALEKLLDADAILKGRYGWLSSVALWTDGRECRMNRQKIKKTFYEHIELLQNGIIQAEQATFVSLFFPAEKIRRFGLPIKEFFLWGDDIEYTRRMAVLEGCPCYIAGQSQVIHAMKSNSGSNLAIDDAERIERYKLAFRNEAYIYRREGIKGICYYLAKRGRDFLWVLTRAKDLRFKRLQVLFCGMLEGMFFHPEKEYISPSAEDETVYSNSTF